MNVDIVDRMNNDREVWSEGEGHSKKKISVECCVCGSEKNCRPCVDCITAGRNLQLCGTTECCDEHEERFPDEVKTRR